MLSAYLCEIAELRGLCLAMLGLARDLQAVCEIWEIFTLRILICITGD